MTERERDAVELLDRIYNRKAGYPLLDAGMVENWIDEEIAAFIRKHGPFASSRSATSESENTDD